MKNSNSKETQKYSLRSAFIVLTAFYLSAPGLVIAEDNMMGSQPKDATKQQSMSNTSHTGADPGDKDPDQMQMMKDHGMSKEAHKKMMQGNSRAANQKHKGMKKMDKTKDQPMGGPGAMDEEEPMAPDSSKSPDSGMGHM